MKQSSILIAKIANDAGIPVSKVEAIIRKIAHAISLNAHAIRISENTKAANLGGQVGGLMHALVLLGADAEMVGKCADILMAEEGI